jgi:Ser/Thr protein kinase RdoA (MazF antagonist)
VTSRAGFTTNTGMAGSSLATWRVLDRWARRWRVVRTLSEGMHSRVALVELDGRPAVARLGPHRSRAIEWEATLLAWLERREVGAPRLLATRDGASHVDDCMVTEHVEGAPVAGDDDWELVGATLRRLHYVCGGWPQRPGSLAARELLTYERGGEVDLAAMPPAARRRCRSDWQPVGNLSTTVVHGDLRPANVRIVRGRAVLLGWGRARVDAPVFDLVTLPRDVSGIDHELWARSRRAHAAWEAARDWVSHPTRARRLLDQLR